MQSASALETVQFSGFGHPPNMKFQQQPPAASIQTPVSLIPRERQQPIAEDTTPDAIFNEPAAVLYNQFLDDDCSIQIGHFAGAITLLWFTPWQQIKSLMCGDADISSISLHLSACFLRYTKYLIKVARIQPYLLPLALSYIYRFRSQCKDPVVGSASSEARLLVTALMTAEKYENDVSYTTASWAKFSNIKIEELKKMELEFLVGIDFKLSVSVEERKLFGQFLMGKLFPVVDRLVSM